MAAQAAAVGAGGAQGWRRCAAAFDIIRSGHSYTSASSVPTLVWGHGGALDALLCTGYVWGALGGGAPCFPARQARSEHDGATGGRGACHSLQICRPAVLKPLGPCTQALPAALLLAALLIAGGRAQQQAVGGADTGKVAAAGGSGASTPKPAEDSALAKAAAASEFGFGHVAEDDEGVGGGAAGGKPAAGGQPAAGGAQPKAAADEPGKRRSGGLDTFAAASEAAEEAEAQAQADAPAAQAVQAADAAELDRAVAAAADAQAHDHLLKVGWGGRQRRWGAV